VVVKLPSGEVQPVVVVKAVNKVEEDCDDGVVVDGQMQGVVVDAVTVEYVVCVLPNVVLVVDN